MTKAEWFILVGAALFVFGAARVLVTADLLRRVIALNVAGAGVLLILMALATVLDEHNPDPVVHALVLTGIVITVSVTGFALVLVRRIERAADADDAATDGTPDPARESDV
ncbi:NADH-quinone oxidoreductase subunit K [Hoyosella sp. YIM 151337]|uniref:NADH-quinone oxidoreductase subunit K n=1 Tax=Hoyosella sp. YIM 151337 TaxID=2992742 RepID=UPI0022360698|nr:NADH-quinone oxidoreductase subunit K [Hoyosella sp. YIM 151337]MCW4353966.1 NADH-quinone oxidoreductase subunit K [Hoyosella sp. YIM 151337]